MHVHINHMWCSDSNWGGHYDSRYMVSISETLSRKPPYDKDPDWQALLTEHEVFSQKKYDFYKKFFTEKLKEEKSDKELRDMSQITTYRLKPEVFAWLEANVKDNLQERHQTQKGFCVGADNYNGNDMGSFSIFFYRRRDAMAFIKQWSIYKKPTTYFNYFEGIRKQLDFKTKTLKNVEEFTLGI